MSTLLDTEGPPAEDPFNSLLKMKLTNVIKWAENEQPRNHQVLMGPSEIGDDCDRRLGYRLAQVPPINTDYDKWPATVGTATHTWLESGFRAWMKAHPDGDEWLTETTLQVTEFMVGHSDLYWNKTVIDWKTAGPDVMKKVRAHGPPDKYKVQAQVYGYGFEQAGVAVERVALVFLPRAGWLRDMFVWTEMYNRQFAELAINRVYGIAQNLLELDILTDGNAHRWEQVNAFPSNECGWCPWYDPGRDLELGADATGCPGREVNS